MQIRVTVQWRIRGSLPRSFTCDRRAFADFVKRKPHYIEWLVADVCMTRWYYQDREWYSAPMYKYVPGQAMVPLTTLERKDKVRHSPRGFTQF